MVMLRKFSAKTFYSPTRMQPRDNSQTGVRWADITLEFPTLRWFPLETPQNSPNFFWEVENL